jgi:hypothetical protein
VNVRNNSTSAILNGTIKIAFLVLWKRTLIFLIDY